MCDISLLILRTCHWSSLITGGFLRVIKDSLIIIKEDQPKTPIHRDYIFGHSEDQICRQDTQLVQGTDVQDCGNHDNPEEKSKKSQQKFMLLTVRRLFHMQFGAVCYLQQTSLLQYEPCSWFDGARSSHNFDSFDFRAHVNFPGMQNTGNGCVMGVRRGNKYVRNCVDDTLRLFIGILIPNHHVSGCTNAAVSWSIALNNWPVAIVRYLYAPIIGFFDDKEISSGELLEGSTSHGWCWVRGGDYEATLPYALPRNGP